MSQKTLRNHGVVYFILKETSHEAYYTLIVDKHNNEQSAIINIDQWEVQIVYAIHLLSSAWHFFQGIDIIN